MGLKGGISIDADSGPLRYVHCTLMLWWYLSPARHFYSDWLWPYCVGIDFFWFDFGDRVKTFESEKFTESDFAHVLLMRPN